MMRLRGFARSKAPDDASDDIEIESNDLASPSKEDRMSERGEDEGNWGVQMTLILILCLLLGLTQYLLRCDNLQLKAASTLIRELQSQEAELSKLLPPQPKDEGSPVCEKALGEAKARLAELRGQSYNAEKQVKELNEACRKTMDLHSELLAEKERMDTQIKDLEKEMHSLAQKLGITT